MKWERVHRGTMISWRGISPVYGAVTVSYVRGSKKWYLMTDPFTGQGTVLGVYNTKKEAQSAAARDVNPRFSKKEEREYRAIVRRHGYGARTKEVAARTVLARRKPKKRGRTLEALRRAGVRIAKVSARGRRATRKRNPVPRGRALGEQSFTLSTLRAVKQGGRAEKIWYEDARDGKHYYHDFDGSQGAIMYLCESAAVGRCVLIVSGDLSTPLWEDA